MVDARWSALIAQNAKKLNALAPIAGLFKISFFSLPTLFFVFAIPSSGPPPHSLSPGKPVSATFRLSTLPDALLTIVAGNLTNALFKAGLALELALTRLLIDVADVA
jgi:hypothetical protein